MVNRPEVLDDDRWGERMNIPWRHHGTGMTFAEVDDLSTRIVLAALQDYSNAVRDRNRADRPPARPGILSATVPTEHIQKIIVDEGLAHSHADELIATYTGWTKGKCLMNFCLTHPYQHVGEIGVIASLLGIEWRGYQPHPHTNHVSPKSYHLS